MKTVVLHLDNGLTMLVSPAFVVVIDADGETVTELTGDEVLRLGELVLLETSFRQPVAD